MPRRTLEKGYYHIYNRGYNKQFIFKTEKHYEKLYSLLVFYLNESIYSNIKILSYCLLPNHFHLIVYNNLDEPNNFSQFMGKIQNAYAKYFNTQQSQRGQLFEGRFKAKKINSKEYLKQAIAYVCFNPIKHEIVENISDYKRSSYHQIDKKKIENYKDLILRELEI